MKVNLYPYKRLLLIILFVLLFNASYSQKLNWILFNWEGETIEGRYFEKFAISVPIRIDDLPYNFKMQLDLGAENTIIYGNAIKSYLDNGLNKKIDTTLHFYFSNQKYPMFKNIDLKLGKVSVGKINIGYLKGYGSEIPIDSIATKSVKFIGTLAPDVFQGKILIIQIVEFV
jgi:hypothetical protein